ncbi:MAG TPA: hypothetical protein VE870_09165 [Bacteroidales bacterium]|nr:hypothetical protein [Bacteroidales bacterium]
MKQIILLVSAVIVLSSCQTNSSKNSEQAANIPVISVDEFFVDPGSYVDREVAIEGLVTHVCKHGGQKLFLAGTETPATLRINTSESIPEFGIEMEGSKTRFHGTVKIMDETFAAEAAAEEQAHHPEGESGDSPEQIASRDKEYYIVATDYQAMD